MWATLLCKELDRLCFLRFVCHMLVPLAKDCLPAEEASTTAEWEQAYDQ
jgi:hypothetical protein